MAFTGKESEKVTLDEASKWTANYRATIKEGEIISHYFGKDNINAILEQKGCVGISIYHGIDNGQKNLILVGMNANEQDMEKGIIVEKGVPCPPRCKESNRLNS
tara:strand:+ start:238 stop:549 length:312 start_codon:yes stop_codon:yes gene_type:complete